MRLFIAIDFNELKDYFVELQSLLPKNAKLNLTKTFHITLKFLGEVQPEKVEEIINKLKMIKFESFNVFFDNIGVFPSENYIRIIWIDVKPEDKVLELQKNVDDSLKDLFKKERDFKAHITLARVKFIDDKKRFLEQLKMIKIKNIKIDVKDFRLIKSTLTPKGPIYEDLGIFKSN